MKRLSFLALTLTAFCSLYTSSQAFAATYYLNQSNELADNVNYAQVDVFENAGNLDFTVTALAPSGWQFSKFFLNLGGNVGTVTLINTPTDWKSEKNKNASDFGKFSNSLKKDSHGDLLSSFTFTADSNLTLSLANLLTNNKGWLFAAHMQCSGDDDDNEACEDAFDEDSHHVANDGTVSNVPVPAAVWLFGSGLVGLISANRRKSVTA